MGFIAWLGLLLNMPETVRRGDVPFSASGVLRDFRDVFRNRVFLFGAATLSLSYIPLMSWVAVSPVILIDDGVDHRRVRLDPGAGLQRGDYCQPVGGALGKRPDASALYLARGAHPDDRAGDPDPRQPAVAARLAVVGDRHLLLRLRHRADLFLTPFRFTLFSNDLPKGTVSASLNIVILSVSALSIEAARWLWFNGGRLPFHLLGVAAGIAAACCLAGLLSRIRQQPEAELAQE